MLKASPPRVVVMGGSMGGLTAGLVLRKIGCDVDVFERSSALLESRGAGIISHRLNRRYPTEFCGYHLHCCGPERYHLGKSVTGFRESGEVVAVSFSDGINRAADLLVCADGINST